MSVHGPLGAASHGGGFDFAGGSHRSGSEATITSSRAWLALGGLLVTGLVISMSAAHTDLLLPQSVRPIIGTGFAGAFSHLGIDLGLGGIIAVLALMFLSYALALRMVREMSPRAVLTSIAALNALVLLAPPLFSTDLFSYVAYGKMGGSYGFNPYVYGPSAISLDHLYPLVGSQWVKTPTVYGPLFTALSYPLAALDVATNVFVYKSIAAASCIAIVVLVWHAARLRGLDPVKAVALVGLNPVIIVYGVGGGHNDLLMLAILVAAVYVLLLQRERASGAMIIGATAIKLTAGMMLPFAIAARARLESNELAARRKRILTGAAIAAAALALPVLALFGIGPLHLFITLQQVQGNGGIHSVPGFILNALGLGQFTGPVGLVLDVAFVILLGVLLRRVWVGDLDWITGAGWATVAMLLTAGLLMPWYIAWLLPLAALSTDRRLWIASIALTCLGLTSL